MTAKRFRLPSKLTVMPYGAASSGRSRQHEKVLLEASEPRSFAIPGKSDDAVGYLRTGEKETPRRRGASMLRRILCACYASSRKAAMPRAKDVCSGFFTQVRAAVSDPFGTAALRPNRR